MMRRLLLVALVSLGVIDGWADTVRAADVSFLSAAPSDVYAATTKLPLLTISECDGSCEAGNCCEFLDDDCGCYCDPLWRVNVGALILHRSRPTNDPIVIPTAGPGVISAGTDFGFGWAAGPDLSAVRLLASGNSLQLRYFGALEWDAAAAYGAVGNVRIGSFSNFGATDLTATYFTKLNSAELNSLRPATDRLSWLVGLRTIQLHDVLNYNIVFPTFNANYYWNADNFLYGGQLGANYALGDLSGPFTMNMALKAGLYSNSASNAFALIPSTGGFFGGGGARNVAAFAGEVNITAAYQLTPHLAIRGGYQLFWLSGVALASDQGAASTANSTQALIDTSGDLFFHGAMAGLDMMW